MDLGKELFECRKFPSIRAVTKSAGGPLGVTFTLLISCPLMTFMLTAFLTAGVGSFYNTKDPFSALSPTYIKFAIGLAFLLVVGFLSTLYWYWRKFFESVRMVVFENGVQLTTWSLFGPRGTYDLPFSEIAAIYFGDKVPSDLTAVRTEWRLTIETKQGKTFRMPSIHHYIYFEDVVQLRDLFHSKCK